MNFHPLEYAKKHPWATGIVIVVGGIIFVLIVRGSGGGSTSSGSTVSGPSDAQIQAEAAVQVAQINANAQTGAAAAQYNAQASIANTAADVQKNQDNLTAEIYKDYIDQTATVAGQNIAAKNTLYQSIVSQISGLKGNGRGEKASVLEALATGSAVDITHYNTTTQTGSSPAAILQGLFGSGGVGGTISSIGSIFG